MRAFWAIIAILLLGGAAAAFFTRSSPSTPGTPAPAASGSNDSADAEAKPPTPQTATQPALPTPTQPTPAPAEPPVDFKGDLTNAIEKAIGTGAEPAKPVTGGTPFELPLNETWPAEKTTPSRAVRVGDELIIDGEYRVKGSGTETDPYVIPFELLMSAADIYDPRKGLTKMPQRIAFLHEKWVRLNGYIAFPIASNDPRHILVMFNQWDGCCIGVPPSTYDSIETNLAKPATAAEKLTIFASTTGVLKVDPYIDSGWLLGLYVLDRAAMSETKTDTDAPAPEPEN